MKAHLLEAERVGSIVGGFYDVYNYYGSGLSEVVYKTALQFELEARGHRIVRELRVPVYYKGRLCRWQRLDMVVDEKVVVEAKARAKLLPESAAQLITYLRATKFEVGVLLHFGYRPSFERFIDWPKRTAPRPASHS